jgi:hypothetical protein
MYQHLNSIFEKIPNIANYNNNLNMWKSIEGKFIVIWPSYLEHRLFYELITCMLSFVT